MSKDDASSPAVRSPPESSRRISRRVGSDNALKTAFTRMVSHPFAGTGDLFRSPSNYPPQRSGVKSQGSVDVAHTSGTGLDCPGADSSLSSRDNHAWK